MTIFGQIYWSGALISMILAFILLKVKFKNIELDPLQTVAFLSIFGLLSWCMVLVLVDDLLSFVIKKGKV